MNKPDLRRKDLSTCFKHALKYMPCKGPVIHGVGGFHHEDSAFYNAFSDVFVKSFVGYPHPQKPLTAFRHEFFSAGKNKDDRINHPYRLALGLFMVIETVKNPARPFNSADADVLNTMTDVLAFDTMFQQRLEHHKKKSVTRPGLRKFPS